MDEIKRKVLKELMGAMDQKANDSLKSRMPKKEDNMAGINYEGRPDKGFGAVIIKEHEMPEMSTAMNSEDDEERLREMYSKLK